MPVSARRPDQGAALIFTGTLLMTWGTICDSQARSSVQPHHTRTTTSSLADTHFAVLPDLRMCWWRIA